MLQPRRLLVARRLAICFENNDLSKQPTTVLCYQGGSGSSSYTQAWSMYLIQEEQYRHVAVRQPSYGIRSTIM